MASQWENASGPHRSPSWFGFMLLVKAERAFHANAISPGISTSTASATACSSAAISCANRPSCNCAKIVPERCASSAKLPGADRIMNESIFVGVYPGLTRAMLDYMIETIRAFCRSSVSSLAPDLEHILAHTGGALGSGRAAEKFFVTGGTGFFGRWLLG